MPQKGKIVAIQTYSDQETLRRKDFGTFSRNEIETAKKMMRALPWSTGERATRRKARGGDEFFDVRATIRRNLKYGGELLEPAWRQTKYKPRPLVVLCDISGSMENYSRHVTAFCPRVARARDTRRMFCLWDAPHPHHAPVTHAAVLSAPCAASRIRSWTGRAERVSVMLSSRSTLPGRVACCRLARSCSLSAMGGTAATLNC